MGWAVVLSKPNSEGVALVNLQRQGYGCYYPRIKVVKPDRTVLIRPLFPRYLFVLFDQLWYSMRGTRGVSHVLMGEDGPAQVPQSVIDALKEREDKTGFICLGKQHLEERFQKNQSVKATEGPLAGLPLIYEGMTSKDRVRVLAEILGRKVTVTVPDSSLIAA